MPFCINCGLHNEEQARFCSGCGSTITRPPAPDEGSSPTPQPARPTPHQHQGIITPEVQNAAIATLESWIVRVMRIPVWILVGIVGLFALFFFAAGIAAITEPEETTGETQQPQPSNAAAAPVQTPTPAPTPAPTLAPAPTQAPVQTAAQPNPTRAKIQAPAQPQTETVTPTPRPSPTKVPTYEAFPAKHNHENQVVASIYLKNVEDMSNGSAFNLALERYSTGSRNRDTHHFTSFYADRSDAEKSSCRNPPNDNGIVTPCDGKSDVDYNSYLGEAYITNTNRMLVHRFKSSRELEEQLSAQAALSPLPGYEKLGQSVLRDIKKVYVFTPQSRGLCAITHQEYLKAQEGPYRKLYIYIINEEQKGFAEMALSANTSVDEVQRGAVASIQVDLEPAESMSGITKQANWSFRKTDQFNKAHPNPVCQ